MSIRLVQLFCDDELWRKWGGSAVRPVQSQSCPASTVIGGSQREAKATHLSDLFAAL